MTFRHLASAALGLILFVFYFWRFLPYSQRMRAEDSTSWWSFLIIALISGFLLSLGVTYRRYWVPTCMLLALFAANAIMIVIDCIPDPTNHNLFPFEFLMIAVMTLPAYFGAFLAAAVDQFRARGMKA
jgi:hypothetical protein